MKPFLIQTHDSKHNASVESSIKLFALNNPAEAQKYFANKFLFTVRPRDVIHLFNHALPFRLIDVRSVEDFEEGHIPGAIHVPQSDWNHTEMLTRDRQNIVYCCSAGCPLAADAGAVFAGRGLPVMEMDGGVEAWKRAGYTLESFFLQSQAV